MSEPVTQLLLLWIQPVFRSCTEKTAFYLFLTLILKASQIQYEPEQNFKIFVRTRSDPSGAVGHALPTLQTSYLIRKIHISVKKAHYSEVMHHHYLLMCICLHLESYGRNTRTESKHAVLWFDMLLRCDTAQWFLSTPPHLYTYVHIASTRQFDTRKHLMAPGAERSLTLSENSRAAGHRKLLGRGKLFRAAEASGRNLFCKSQTYFWCLLFRRSAIIMLKIFIYRAKKNCMSVV